MERLSRFQHDIIRHIHDWMNRAKATALEASHHPQRCRDVKRDTSYQSAAIQRTGLWCLHAYSQSLIDLMCDWHDLAQFKSCIGYCRHFTGNACQPEAVAPIGRQLEREKLILKFIVLAKIIPVGRIGWKNQQTIHSIF